MLIPAMPISQFGRQRVLDALAHRGGGVALDFGSTSVTGIHATIVAALRQHYGLERRPVRIHEPMQMLAIVEDDLAEAMGVDTIGVPRRRAHFGLLFDRWKPWRFRGLDVEVSADFNVTEADNGDALMHPQGDVSVPPSGRMPKDGFFFDAIIRQKPIDLDHLDPADNAEQYQPLTESQLDEIEQDARALESGDYAVFASLVNTNLGDIAWVPGPDLIEPKGVRDVAEWYMLTASRPDVVHKIFERQVEVGVGNLERIHQRLGDDAIDVIFLCGSDFGTQTSSFC